MDICESKCHCTKPVEGLLYPRQGEATPIWSAGDLSIYRGFSDHYLWVTGKDDNGKIVKTKIYLENGNSNGGRANQWTRSALELLNRKKKLLHGHTRKKELPPSSPLEKGVCSQSCKAADGFYCSSSDCKCLLQEVGKGLWDLGECGLISFPGSGKREAEQWVCPCNTTYVSSGCCHSEDGIVWEDKDAWLGRMVNQDASGV